LFTVAGSTTGNDKIRNLVSALALSFVVCDTLLQLLLISSTAVIGCCFKTSLKVFSNRRQLLDLVKATTGKATTGNTSLFQNRWEEICTLALIRSTHRWFFAKACAEVIRAPAFCMDPEKLDNFTTKKCNSLFHPIATFNISYNLLL